MFGVEAAASVSRTEYDSLWTFVKPEKICGQGAFASVAFSYNKNGAFLRHLIRLEFPHHISCCSVRKNIFLAADEQLTMSSRRGGISLEYDSDGTNESDLDEYDEDNDSIGSLEDFIVEDENEEESDYEVEEDELIEDTDDMESISSCESEPLPLTVDMPPRRSRRLEGRPRNVVLLSDDDMSESEDDDENESAASDEINYS